MTCATRRPRWSTPAAALPAAALPAATLGDLRFHGMWLDPTGLYHDRARTYDPQSGRFLSRDPARADPRRPQTFAPYTFANASPYLWRDLTGAYSLRELATAVQVRVTLAMRAVATAGLGFLKFLRRMLRTGAENRGIAPLFPVLGDAADGPAPQASRRAPSWTGDRLATSPQAASKADVRAGTHVRPGRVAVVAA